jgi:Sulfotransferase family/Tetratricopeptide repeat
MDNSAKDSPPLGEPRSAGAAQALYERGKQFHLANDYDDAIREFNQLLQIDPSHADALHRLASCLYLAGRVAAALTAYRRALKGSPNHPDTLIGIGNCYQSQGMFDRAAAYYEKALKVAPNSAECLYNLVFVNDYPPFARPVKKLQEMHRSLGDTDKSRILVCFALGKVFENHGEHRRAFQYYHEGNRLQSVRQAYDESGLFSYFDQLEELFKPELFARLKEAGSSSAAPIFVLGLPRSGTSLVEQILATHSAVFSCGEAGIVPHVAGRLIPHMTGKPYPYAVKILEPAAFTEIAEHVLERLRSYCPRQSQHLVSKTNINYYHIGLIRILYPRAAIIHCVRDPMDTCWSLHRHHFVEPQAYSYDLAALGRYYCRYQQLMRHWHQVLPGEIYDLRYERLVTQPEDEMKALLKHCRLPWDDKVLTFYRTRRTVTTASARQVRRPIYTSSINSWEPVADELAPLRRALQGL